jgi:hypothetical protein
VGEFNPSHLGIQSCSVDADEIDGMRDRARTVQFYCSVCLHRLGSFQCNSFMLEKKFNSVSLALLKGGKKL